MKRRPKIRYTNIIIPEVYINKGVILPFSIVNVNIKTDDFGICMGFGNFTYINYKEKLGISEINSKILSVICPRNGKITDITASISLSSGLIASDSEVIIKIKLYQCIDGYFKPINETEINFSFIGICMIGTEKIVSLSKLNIPIIRERKYMVLLTADANGAMENHDFFLSSNISFNIN